MIGLGYMSCLLNNMNNEYFKQVNIQFPKISIEDIKGDLVVEHLDPLTNTGIRYWKLKDTELNKHIIDMFTSIGLENPIITYAEVDGNIWLHKDINGTVVVNHYIETPKAVTTFYIANNNYQGIKIGKDTIYDPMHCEKKDEFVAESNTSYILDVSSIHGVSLLESGVRKFLSIGFLDWTYREIITENILT